MEHHLGLATAAALVALLTGGCSGDDADPASSTPTSSPPSEVQSAAHLLVSKEEPTYKLRHEESITGLLTVDENGCVTVERDGEQALLWAPAGSSLSDDGTSVAASTLEDDLMLGSTVTFEGEWTSVLAPVKASRPDDWTTCVSGDESTIAFVSY